MDEQQYKLLSSSILQLTQEQVSDLANRLKIINFASTKQFNGKSDFGVRVSEAISKVLHGRGVECPSPTTLRKSSAYASSRPKFDDVAAFFAKISSHRLVQDSILVEGISLLYDDLLQWQGIAISSHTILQQIHRLPSTLNRAFPGYAESGKLHKVIKGLK